MGDLVYAHAAVLYSLQDAQICYPAGSITTTAESPVADNPAASL